MGNQDTVRSDQPASRGELRADEATYVYAVARGLDASQLHDVTGVGGQAVRVVEHGGLTALASTVRLDEFGEDALHRNLEDLNWLESTARAHHGVVATVGAIAPTAPLRLATVCHGDERVRQLLAEQREAFTAALARVDGRTEWGIKAYADPDAFAAAAAPEDTGSGSAGPGTAFLQRRRSERRGHEDAGRAAAERADAIHAALSDLAAASRRHPAQDQRLTGHAGWMVLNGAYLVDNDRDQDFREVVAGFDDYPGIAVELTGPWVPYSFADPEKEP